MTKEILRERAGIFCLCKVAICRSNVCKKNSQPRNITSLKRKKFSWWEVEHGGLKRRGYIASSVTYQGVVQPITELLWYAIFSGFL